MVVDLSNIEAVRGYVAHQADHGLDNVVELVRGERDAMMALIGDLAQEEADTRIDDGQEYSVSMVLQHLNAGFERSSRRLWTLASGQAFTGSGGTPQGGGLPDILEQDFNKVRQQFLEGSNDILAIIHQAAGNVPSDITAPHVLYGHFTWLEWAVYSHHVHTGDHVRQVAKIKGVLRDQY